MLIQHCSTVRLDHRLPLKRPTSIHRPSVRERLAGQQSFPNLLRLFASGVIFSDVHTPIGVLHLNENFSKRDFRRRCEFLPMFVVNTPWLPHQSR